MPLYINDEILSKVG